MLTLIQKDFLNESSLSVNKSSIAKIILHISYNYAFIMFSHNKFKYLRILFDKIQLNDFMKIILIDLSKRDNI